MSVETEIPERFEIVSEAGSGGMGTVYRARDRETNIPVAIKVLQGSIPESEAPRFAREAQAIADLRHPAIVRYVAHGSTRRGAQYLVMEWLEGEDLRARLAKAPLGVADAVALAIRVAGALSVVHAHGIVHRDIKPANIFLTDGRTDTAKLIDFGVAHLDFGEALTRTGVALGTPGYMAPEQVRAARDIDGRADIYALGCVLFRCITGTQPHAADNVISYYAKVLLEEAPRLRTLCPDVPNELDHLVARMLSKEPAGRPANADAVIEALSSLAPQCRESAARMPAAPTITTVEKRLLTMMLVGPTEDERRALAARSEDTRPERGAAPTVRLKGGTSRADVESIVSKCGGRVDHLLNGARLVTRIAVGRPADEAARMARCALALRAVLPDAPMAIAMGRSELAGEARALDARTGSVIERVTALLDLAATAGAVIRVDDVAGALLASRFDLRRDEGGLLLESAREGVEPARKILGRPTPCLGRDRELGLLDALLEECLSEPVARVALVTGPPGIGKTRVMQEFLLRAQQREEVPEIWITHGDELNAGSAFGMLARALHRASGLRGGETLEAQRSALGDRIASVVKGDDTPRAQFFLGEVCGIPFPTEEARLRAAREDPTKLGENVQWAFERLLSAECEAQPVLLVLEDLHWGDLPSVRMLDAALRALADRPLFILALARPEVHDIFPKLWSARAPQVLSLSELNKKVAARLVKDLLGARADASMTATLVERAAGNAFFLEELIRAVAEGREDEIPDSVLAVVQARLQALEPEARRILRAASIFGQQFTRSGVDALVSGGIQSQEDWLNELVRREVIVPERPAHDSDGNDDYRFCHALVHQAAYAMLTEADCRLGHRLAGEWLEKSGARDAMMLASHFERAGEAVRAGAYYAHAAEDAFRGGDLSGAALRCSRAIESGVDGEVLGGARWIAAEASRHLGDHKAAAEHVAEAMRLLPPGSPRWYQAQRTAIFVGMTSHYGKKS